MILSNTNHIKGLLLILLFFVVEEKVFFCQIESSNEITGFRNSSWGSSVSEVKNNETETYMQSFKGFGIYTLSYKSKLEGLTAWIDYTFRNGKLIEGSYSFKPQGYFKNDFDKLKNYLIAGHGKPDFRSGHFIESDSVWIKINEYGSYKGPELYWLFRNGFIALIASKFEKEITIIILYSSNSIEEYNKDRETSIESFL